MNTEIAPKSLDWQQQLRLPFEPEQVRWRVQGKAAPNSRAQVLAYLDARDVQDRLDSVVGAENWSFTWTPVVTNEKALLVAKGTLAIYAVDKEDVGDASNWEGNKGTVSDALKRAGVMWGIGRYLYNLPDVWITLDAAGNMSEATLKSLQASLARKFSVA